MFLHNREEPSLRYLTTVFVIPAFYAPQFELLIGALTYARITQARQSSIASLVDETQIASFVFPARRQDRA